jgi:hypothetical protein
MNSPAALYLQASRSYGLNSATRKVLLGEQQVLKETQVLCTLHEQFLGV